MSDDISKQSWVDIETNGIRCSAYLYRDDGRWKVLLFPGGWIEKDFRRELEEGFVLAVDPKSARTNGIPFVQLSKRYTEKSE
jgi:hypothetical protein